MAAPGYQGITDAQIPSVELGDGAGRVRVIAGDYLGHKGPAHTFTPIDVWDVRLNQGASVTLPVPEGRVAAIVVLRGTVMVNGDEVARDAQMVLLDRAGDALTLEANNDAVVLLLSGESIDEPIVGHGPFVMNTRDEIVQAMKDFGNGRFGQMPAH
jgi:redox-sensitive bicupin YhaK (pirin superfamily)